MNNRTKTIDPLDLPLFSYNDLADRFRIIQRQMRPPIKVRDKFLEYFKNEVLNHSTNTNDLECILVEVFKGVAYCKDARVEIVDHDNFKDEE
ncbi:hypothetical protein HN014_22230 (plasmid) [Aquimarina sp. TRL1]|uniref:hypothetical protein n=1 Tax=Aquimarina sp. (strain TRL1) TaxID=2736252 RepID=UPI00158A8DAB|nr:hypothetical protein [Aquimarina sp. TRL1]QKX07720.1 hypothetical protein HN014_22230 [Aquimarina sp. TRL1]